MAHISIDESFFTSWEVESLSAKAFRLHLEALMYAKRYDLDTLSPAVVTYHRRVNRCRQSHIDELVTVGLWRRHITISADLATVTDHGYQLAQIHVPPRTRRPSIPDAIRAAVYERDEHACVICGAADSLTLDHVIPFSHGGPDTLDNLRAMCRPCNSRRGAALMTDEELRCGN